MNDLELSISDQFIQERFERATKKMMLLFFAVALIVSVVVTLLYLPSLAEYAHTISGALGFAALVLLYYAKSIFPDFLDALTDRKEMRERLKRSA